MNHAEAYAAISKIVSDRMLYPGECETLWKLANKAPAGSMLIEIGSYTGLSTCMIASGMSEQSTLIAIDPHEGQPDTANPNAIEIDPGTGASTIGRLHQALRKGALDAHVAIIGAESRRAHVTVQRILNGRTVPLLFIDGSHLETHVLADLQLYTPLVHPGGFLIMDDADYGTVMPAIEAFGMEEHSFIPFDLGLIGVVDETHKRTHEGRIDKMACWRKNS